MKRTPLGNIPEKDDIVVVVGSESIPKYYLGSYGRVTDEYFGKAIVELKAKSEGRGSLSHTAYISDLKVVAERKGQW